MSDRLTPEDADKIVDEQFFAGLPGPDFSLIVYVRVKGRMNSVLPVNWPPLGWKTGSCPLNDSATAIRQWFDFLLHPRGVVVQMEKLGGLDCFGFVHDSWLLLDHLNAAGEGNISYIPRLGPITPFEAKVELRRILDHLRTAPKFRMAFVDLNARKVETPKSLEVADLASRPAGDMKPKTYLKNWAEILDCVGLKNNKEDRLRVRELNQRFKGPINLPTRGGQPFVEKTKLIDWWNRLEIEWETPGPWRES